jgi:hypothetical protein
VEDGGDFGDAELVDGGEEEGVAFGFGEPLDFAEDDGDLAGVGEGRSAGAVRATREAAKGSSSWSGRMRRRRSRARFQVMRTSQTRRSRTSGSLS